VRAWLSKERPGPKSSGDIADIIELMLATGARIGEVLALRWADVDLRARVVDVNATIKTESGIGTYRKPLGRPRLVALPEGAALILQARRRTSADNFLDAVFPTRKCDMAAGQQRRATLAADSPRGWSGVGHS
jgi:integrase